MRLPDGFEARQRALNIAEDKRRAACLHLDVVAARGSDRFDIFIGLDTHGRDRCGACAQKARGGVEMLVQKAAMNGLNPFELATIKHRGAVPGMP
jgi:hypothetical protein